MTHRIRKSINIAAPPATVFDTTQNYDRRLEWDTFLKKAELLGTREADIGVKAWCVSKYGLGMETQYVSFNRPKVTAVEMSDSSFIFQSFAGSWRFEQFKTSSTKVLFTYSYELKPVFKLVSPVVSIILGKEIARRLQDLKEFIEGGPSTG